MNASQVTAILKKAHLPDTRARSVEFSRGGCDLKRLRAFLQENGNHDDVLGDYYGYGAYPL